MRKFTDQEIIEGIREGGKSERKCMEYLYNKHRHDFLNHVILKVKLDLDERISCYNDAFIAILKMIKTDEFKEGHPIKPLLKTIYSNKCVDHLRKSTNNKNRTTRGASELSTLLTDDAASIIDKMIKEDLISKILHVIKTLKPSCRNILRLFLLGYSHKEIVAESPKINSIKSPKVMLSRCIKKLRDIIDPENPSDK